ncbi:MAG: SDR family oxidoreductase, partial [Comamonadaceae bacterium]
RERGQRLPRAAAGVAQAESAFGGLDFIVSVAGGGTRQTLATLTPEDWHAIIDLNLTGPFNAVKAGAPALRRRGGGAIVTVGSLAGLRMSMNNGVSYTAAKAGVLGLTRHAAYELGSDNIRVNAVLPGPVLTPQMQAKISAETLARVPRELPLGRWVQPAEVAAPILFFCSPMASACTGTHVIIDCGLHVGATSSRDEYDRTRDRAAAAPTA